MLAAMVVVYLGAVGMAKQAFYRWHRKSPPMGGPW